MQATPRHCTQCELLYSVVKLSGLVNPLRGTLTRSSLRSRAHPCLPRLRCTRLAGLVDLRTVRAGRSGGPRRARGSRSRRSRSLVGRDSGSSRNGPQRAPHVRVSGERGSGVASLDVQTGSLGSLHLVNYLGHVVTVKNNPRSVVAAVGLESHHDLCVVGQASIPIW